MALLLERLRMKVLIPLHNQEQQKKMQTLFTNRQCLMLRSTKTNQKDPLDNPYDSVNSSMKNIQIILDNLTKDINKILETARSYVDAASNVLMIFKI